MKKLSSTFRLILIFILPAIISFLYGCSHDKQNYGLKKPQDPSTLPRSAVPVVMPERIPKVSPHTLLEYIGDGQYRIQGGWELASAREAGKTGEEISKPAYSSKNWFNATVPGTVLTTLVDQGVYPDPYFGVNNLSIPDTLCRTDWWYRTTFEVPASRTGKKAWLIFDGINYKADIWLNGNLIGNIDGAFSRGVFDVARFVSAKGINILAVHILPPPHPGIPHEESPRAGTGPNGGQLCLDGPTFISSEGWDWIPGIRDRNIGIWQDVKLKFTGPVTISNPQVITELPLPDTTSAALTVRATLNNTWQEKESVTLRGTIEGTSFAKTVELDPGQSEMITLHPAEFPQLNIQHPRLWWPNGYGKPELYRLYLTLTDSKGNPLDSLSVRFGIRELSYELTIDAPGEQGMRIDFNPIKDMANGLPIFDNLSRREVMPGTWVPELRKGVDIKKLTRLADTSAAPFLVIKVNGQRIFCRGGNWGMDDGMKRVSRQRLEPYFRLHRDAHFNMIRNWTGESTEETFFNLADEYGMLVWNDFWLSTEGYNLPAKDNQLFLDNALEVIRRFRNHPSIAIWCPRNEGYAPAEIEEGLATMIAMEDGTRYYQGNSRYLNLRPSGPWNYFTEPEKYYTEIAEGFSTELGTPSVPAAESMRSMMAKEDVWPISDVWYYHDLHNGQKEYIAAIESQFGKPSGLDDFCMKAQMINYESHRAMFESWNSKMWNKTSGLLLWMSHPAWPSTVWQVYSWDYETFGSYYASRKACEPIHIQMNLNDRKVIALNTTLHEVKGAKASVQLYDLQSKKLWSDNKIIDLPANGKIDCFVAEPPGNLPDVYFVKLELRNSEDQLLSDNFYWQWAGKGPKNFNAFNTLPQVTLAAEAKPIMEGRNYHIQVKLTNPGKTMALAIKLNLRQLNGERILPAYISDGYFSLLPGESRMIDIFCPASLVYGTTRITAIGYNVPEQEVAVVE